MQDNARVFDMLMRRLGYEKYVAQGGDWGHFPVRELGARYGERCKAIHFNYAPGMIPEGLARTEWEKRAEARSREWLERHAGYAVLMRNRVSVRLLDGFGGDMKC